MKHSEHIAMQSEDHDKNDNRLLKKVVDKFAPDLDYCPVCDHDFCMCEKKDK